MAAENDIVNYLTISNNNNNNNLNNNNNTLTVASNSAAAAAAAQVILMNSNNNNNNNNINNNNNLNSNIIINNNNISESEQQKLKDISKLERSIKIERYKNKRRNWIRKIAYDCRKRVADSRLRIKGRFISKKDCEKIK